VVNQQINGRSTVDNCEYFSNNGRKKTTTLEKLMM